MAEVWTQAQVDAVVAHLSAEYDAAQAYVRGKASDISEWFDKDQLLAVAKDLGTSKVDEIKAITAAADRNPDRVPQLARDAEKDLRDYSGYSQQASVDDVIRRTAVATVDQAGQLAHDAAQGALNAGGFVLGTLLKAIPWPVYAVAGVGALAVGWFYLRPLLPSRRPA